MTRIHDIDTALTTLDVADPDVDPAGPRARADLQRILATTRPALPAPADRHRRSAAGGRRGPGRAAHGARRFALAGGVLATVAGGIVALPALTGGDQAFASWTQAPHGMTATQRADAVDGCRRTQEDAGEGTYADELRGAEVAVAERRGVWTTVVLAGSDGFSALCISDDSAHLFARDAIGSIGTPTGYAAPGPRELVATDLGTGSMDAGDLSMAVGSAGSAVAGVTYHSQIHGDVVATVSHGRFALWLPGDELEDASADNPVEVEVTYDDGSTGTSKLTL
ncbi:hypothetical protein [Nocardioides mesophilus]|uniref:Uncharacterized protein n=1 Tax=Nocardioides mesophilus TaxID=433659 RepID=A0A7G9RET3_9ACTN|nr:hypothetical protein [Nocardioides mesophilus]QNN54108.1 hypothetical protein H9L09_06975 [Nocardioides mesophilus]